MGLCPNLSAYQSDDMKRIVYIDLLKGLAIIGIVLLHAGFDMFTASLYVPVFFMVSGYFFKRERMVDILKKRTRQLLLPYLWFVALFFLTEWLFDFLNVHGIVTSLRYTINRVHLFKNCTILHKSIWFLPVLFCISIIYRMVWLLKDKRLVHVAVLLIFLMGCLVGKYWHSHVIYLSDTILSSIIYFHVGYMMKRYESKIDQFHWLLLIIPIILWIVLIVLLNPVHAYKSNDFPIYLPLMVIPSVVSLFSILKRLKFVEITMLKPIKIVGKYSLGVLGYHAFCNISLMNLNIGDMVSSGTLPYIRLLVVLIAVPLLVAVTVKFAPALIGKPHLAN